MAKKATEKYQYSRLADIKEREIQNVYGVVKFKKAPFKSRGTGRDDLVFYLKFLNFVTLSLTVSLTESVSDSVSVVSYNYSMYTYH
jgi:hypothetical protein